MSLSWRGVFVKLNVPKLVWHNFATFGWKIAPMELTSVEAGTHNTLLQHYKDSK